MTEIEVQEAMAAFNAAQNAKKAKRDARRVARRAPIENMIAEGLQTPEIAAAIASPSKLSVI